MLPWLRAFSLQGQTEAGSGSSSGIERAFNHVIFLRSAPAVLKQKIARSPGLIFISSTRVKVRVNSMWIFRLVEYGGGSSRLDRTLLHFQPSPAEQYSGATHR